MKIYRSKIDIGLSLFVFGLLILVVLLMSLNGLVAPAVIAGIVLLFVLQLFIGTQYTINGDQLTITAGILYKITIPINSISKLESTKNAIASPAISLDRISIQYAPGRSILISPKNKLDFISDLKSINPHIEVGSNLAVSY